jgi:putative membrane protein
MHDDWGWWMIFGWMWMIVFWGLIIWAVLVIVGRISAASHEEHAARALRILEERYARGEITREQFEQMRADLRSGPSARPT